jgi:hypothetical protein
VQDHGHGQGRVDVQVTEGRQRYVFFQPAKTVRTRGTLNLSSKRSSHQDSLIYTQFSRTHSSSISSSIHYRAHLSLYLNISMCYLVLIDLLKRI